MRWDGNNSFYSALSSVYCMHISANIEHKILHQSYDHFQVKVCHFLQYEKCAALSKRKMIKSDIGRGGHKFRFIEQDIS